MAGSLPKALGRLGIETLVMTPRYRGVRYRHKKIAENAHVLFVENEEYFNRAGIYGNEKGDYPDNLRRFGSFCEDALLLAKELGFRPDIVHAHDWQAALLPVLLKTKYYSDHFFRKTRSLFTIHNLAYQGVFPHRQFKYLGLPESLFGIHGFEFFGKVNFMKAGLLYADAISTVSERYTHEIQTLYYGYGLDGVIRKRRARLHGILNGIDADEWDPAADRTIAARYSARRLEGKAANKADLQRRLGLEVNPETPLFAMVTRLAQQKGLDLLSEVADAFCSKPVQFVLLGEGDAAYQRTFENIHRRHPGNTRMLLRFSPEDSRRIYAGADFFLMPSLFEPCGLGQMISLRYGTIPIVRATGGLADTVKDIGASPDTGNGFSFPHPSPEELLRTIDRAIKLFRDRAKVESLRRRAMTADYSWNASAKRYRALYREILKA